MTTPDTTQAKELTVAKLVWDGGDQVHIPDDMGAPSETQMKGTPMELVSELACRICYDSLGRGRSSAELHEHILGVKHLSVYEHTPITVELNEGDWGREFPSDEFLNRPGVWVRFPPTNPETMRITFNPRVVLNWDIFSANFSGASPYIKDLLSFAMEPKCPQILKPQNRGEDMDLKLHRIVRVVEPETDHEQWITMLLAGSRGFSHELVRHGDFTAISQRSTRYVDEDGSPWVDHPLVEAFLDDPDNKLRTGVAGIIDDTKEKARTTYATVAKHLQSWLKGKGVDKFNARKQARGAARGYLGNALHTEIIFSASVAQWKHMLRMRCCAPADAEIREVFTKALPELQKSRYGHAFRGFSLEPAKDGLGMVAIEKEDE